MDRTQEDGIRSSNQEFRRYEQVRKQQVYGLSERSDHDQFDDEYRIQVCDIGQFLHGGERGKRVFAQELGNALEGIGFAIITGHGIDQTLYDETDQEVKRFFETIERAERMPYLAKRQGSVNQGYFPIRETTIIHPDLVEGWVFCRRAFDLDANAAYDETAFWPRAGFEPRFRRVCIAQEKLVLPVMQSILRYLGCDPRLYDRKLTRPNFGFRLNYYPPLSVAGDGGGGRMLGHEDIDLFTFLPAPRVGGLQVLNRRNMKWIRLNAPPGSIILNTGDYAQRISNDRLPSTTHRVSRPDPAQSGEPRVSFPMAIYLWEHEILEVLPGQGEPKYEPIEAIKFHTRITSKYYGDDYAVG